MSNDPNEELIEATMRRVAQARAGHADGEARHIAEDAARNAAGGDAVADTPSSTLAPPEDAIEATIRRVAEAQAARASGAGSGAEVPIDLPLDAERADEDEIEATIRRVSEAQAARAVTAESDLGAASVNPPLEDSPLEDERADDDPIEATIRRVAEAQAARVAATDSDLIATVVDPSMVAERANEDAIEATAHGADAQAAPAVVADTQPIAASLDPLSQGERADEDEIDAAIRRVAEAQAARLDGVPAADVLAIGAQIHDQSDIDAVAQRAIETRAKADADALSAEAAENERRQAQIDATIRRVAQSQAARAQDAASAEDRAITERQPAASNIGREQPAHLTSAAQDNVASVQRDHDAGTWQDAVARLEAKLEETQRELKALATRFDALAPLVGRSQAVPHLEAIPAAGRRDEDDDWPVAPQVGGQFGAPPRQAIYRDPSPMTATAELLQQPEEEPDAIDEEQRTPTPITAGTAHSVGGSPAESRRGLDLLPRTYRITVEDKRRGVDLVPLHRALRGLDGMRDMSLLSYSNGVAMVALETVGPVSPEALAEAVSRAMAREAIVEVHNEQTMVVKLVEN